MPVRRKKERQKQGSPPYMTTWGDMQTLMLTFFVFLFAISTLNPVKFELVLSAFRGAFSVMPGGKTLTKAELTEMGLNIMSLPAAQYGKQLGDVEWKAIHILREFMTKGAVRVRRDERGIVITITSRVLFRSGEAVPTKEGFKILDKVALLLKSIPNYVRIEGHTDDTPIAGKLKRKYQTNWELSTARAVNVLRYFVEMHDIDPKRLSASGYAQYRPLYPNIIPEFKALNRRVDIVILRREKAAREEPEAEPLTEELNKNKI